MSPAIPLTFKMGLKNQEAPAGGNVTLCCELSRAGVPVLGWRGEEGRVDGGWEGGGGVGVRGGLGRREGRGARRGGRWRGDTGAGGRWGGKVQQPPPLGGVTWDAWITEAGVGAFHRSEEHTSELQSR